MVLTREIRHDTPWLYISGTPGEGVEWIYISSMPTEFAEWVYISNSPEGADLTIYADDPKLKTPDVVACVLAYLQKQGEDDSE